MSGDIVDLPARVCPSCALVYVEDDRTYEDTTICPRCGADLSAATIGKESIYE